MAIALASPQVHTNVSVSATLFETPINHSGENMNATNQVEVVEEQVTETEQQDIELNLADLDLVGGGNACNTFS
jgi:hypothetical protein